MTNYENTVMYKIVNYEVPEFIYIGHTTNFIKRKFLHKSMCNNPCGIHYNIKLYLTIREHGGWLDWNMIEIKKFPCTTKQEACIEEDRLMIEFSSNLNMVRAYRSYDDKKDYYLNNKEKIYEVKKLYSINNKDLILARYNNYYANNKEIVNKRRAVRYVINKDLINEKRREKIECECGCVLAKANMADHKKTIKHMNLLNE